VELARQSADGRVTLVIEDAAMPVRTLWAIMDSGDMEVAKEALARREGMSNIDHIGSWKTGDMSPASIPQLPAWAAAHGLNAVIWTALQPKFNGKTGAPPKIEDVLDYLGRLEGAKQDNAERYIRLAPRQIDTQYRRRIEVELGWTPLDKWPA